jgi:serine/threonine-protein kinase
MTERFTLIEKIGRGGMGVVWRAHDEETDQVVALKLLHSAYSDDPDYVTRFERELELARRIKSPNVVGVLGYGVRDGTPYLALEYVDGKSLREILATHGKYSWDEARPLLAQVARGLADAHAAGVVHRDIKPSNILIGSDGVAKIADFGIARGLDLTRVTGTSTLLGTPAYLPPEGPQDERSDLYSLGIVAYELMAGVPPFEGSTYAEVLMAHVRLSPDLARLPAEARPIVGWLLEKDPKARPQSATELIEALEGKRAVPAAVAVAAVSRAYAASSTTQTVLPANPPSRRSRRRAFAAAGVAGVVLMSAATFAAGSHLLLPGATPTTMPSRIDTTQALAVATGSASPLLTPGSTTDSMATLTLTTTPTPTLPQVATEPVVTAPPVPPVVTASPAPPIVTAPPVPPVVTASPAPPIVTASPAPQPKPQQISGRVIGSDEQPYLGAISVALQCLEGLCSGWADMPGDGTWSVMSMPGQYHLSFDYNTSGTLIQCYVSTDGRCGNNYASLLLITVGSEPLSGIVVELPPCDYLFGC